MIGLDGDVAWQALAAMALKVLAFGAVAAGCLQMFSGARARVFGRQRWLIAVGMLVAALGQLGRMVLALNGEMAAAEDVNLLGSVFLLFAAGLIWPVLGDAGGRIAAVQERRLQRRLRIADAKAAEALRWMQLAEEIAHVGHWYYYLESDELTWSDEIYRIHGVSKAYQPSVTAGIGFYHPQDRPIIARHFQQAISEKLNYEASLRIIRPDGLVRQVIARGAVQLNAGGEVTAVFGVFMDITEQKLVEESLRQANVQAALNNRLLQEMALVDSLTGLPNRRHFDTALEAEFRRAAREQTTLAVIMIDLDHFKAYNDLYGHPAGDDCLRLVAAAIAGVAKRPGDLVARYGGEEMVVLLPGASEDGAAQVAEKAAAAVRHLALVHGGSPAGMVTISAGVSVWGGAADAQLPLELLRQADLALYQAKQGGRDRICVHAPAPLILAG